MYPSDAANKNYTLSSDANIVAFPLSDRYVVGRHAGKAVITAATEDGGHTAECAVTSKLAQTRYVPSVHGWGFGNDYNTSDNSYFKDVYRRISGSAATYSLLDTLGLDDASLFTDSANMLWYATIGDMSVNGKGMCAGFAISSALTYSGDIPFSTWEFNSGEYAAPAEVKTLTELEGYSSSLELYLKQFILACHMSQTSLHYLKQTNIFAANNYESLFKKVTDFQKSGKNPFVIKLSKPMESHELLPYELLELSNQYWLFVYDPNAVNFSRDPNMFYIVFNKDEDGKITDWFYPDMGYNSSNSKIYTISSLSEIASRIKKKELFNNVKTFFTSASNLLLSKGDSTLAQCTGSALSSLADTVAAVSSLPEGMTGTALCMDDLSGITAAAGAGTTAFYTEKAAFIVSCGAPATLEFTGNGLNVLSAPNEQIAIQYNSIGSSVLVRGTVPQAASVRVDSSGAVSFTGFSDIQPTALKDGRKQTGESRAVSSEETYIISQDTTSAAVNELTWVEAYAFENCRTMTACDLPEGVNAIGQYAFRNCTALTSLTLPETILIIEEGAFDGCKSLTVTVREGSYALAYCRQHDIPYRIE